MLVGYARVSTTDQVSSLQTDALQAAGCEKIFQDKASGAKAERPGLNDALEFMRRGRNMQKFHPNELPSSTIRKYAPNLDSCRISKITNLEYAFS